MNLFSTIIKNSSFLFFARVANPAVTVVIGLYIAKTLGVEYFGQFSFVLSYFFLISMVFSLGLGTIVSRDTAKSPEEVGLYFSNASLIGIVSGAAGIILMLLTASLFNLSGEGISALYIISLAIFPSILIYIWESLIITFEKNHYIVAVQSVESLIKIVLGFFFLYKGYGLAALMGVFLFSRVAGGVIYYFALARIFRPMALKIDMRAVRKIVMMVPAFAGLYVFSVLFSKLDIMMIALMKDYNDVGIYSAAYKLLEISFMLPTCVIAVFFPVLSRYSKESRRDFMNISTKGIFYSVAVLFPAVIVLIYFGDSIIYTLYSREFTGSILSFQILIVTLGFYMIDQIFAHSLVACDLQNLNLKAVVSGTVINIVLNLMLIPRYSYIGASVATLVSMAAVTAIHYYFVSRHLYRFNFAKMTLAISIAIFFFGVLYLIRSIPLIILLPLAVITYTFLVIAIKFYFSRCGPVCAAR
ncbi:MAG: hypothetical protein AMK70_00590 [Nitrospira bacterium SG8_35_1]|nr:MAG: hypothetical protein AMK70_00590 [Nitrospira bacterium SG8_35_1]